MIGTLNLIIAAGLVAILFGYVVGKQVLSSSHGNAKIEEITAVEKIPNQIVCLME